MRFNGRSKRLEGENRRIAITTATKSPAAVPTTSAAPKARVHAADRLLAQLNTIEAIRPNRVAAMIAIDTSVNISTHRLHLLWTRLQQTTQRPTTSSFVRGVTQES